MEVDKVLGLPQKCWGEYSGEVSLEDEFSGLVCPSVKVLDI